MFQQNYVKIKGLHITIFDQFHLTDSEAISFIGYSDDSE